MTKYEEMMDSLAAMLGSSTDVFASFMRLSDESFEHIAPLVEEEFKRSLTEPNNVIMLKNLFATADFEGNSFSSMIEELDSENTNLSTTKKEFLKHILIALDNCINVNIPKDSIIRVPFEAIDETVITPVYATIGAAGMDLYANEEVTINPGETVLVSTGIKTELPDGYALLVHPRSGTSRKTKLRIANSIGLIDSDYRGEIKVIMENIDAPIKNVDLINGELIVERGTPITISKGERFAQMRLVYVPKAELHKVEKVNDTARGEGGFGSTGIH